MLLLVFLMAFFHRAFSGLQNGIGYSKASNDRQLLWSSVFLSIYALVSWVILAIKFDPNSTVLLALGVISVGVAMISSMAVCISFTDKTWRYGDIHLWELILTGSYFMACIFANSPIIPVVLSVYPALILHKGLINRGSSKPFFYHGTDDKSGKTYGIPILNISIPRGSLFNRLVFAGISIITMVVATITKWGVFNYNVHDMASLVGLNF